MTKSLIFFDIDGTLLDHNNQLPQSTKLTIKALKEKGHKVAIATGRAPIMFYDLAEELGVDSYVCFNGQYVVVKNEVVYKNPLHKDTVRKLSEFALSKEHPLVYMCHEKLRSSVEYHPYIEETLSKKYNRPPFDPEYFEEQEIYQCQLFCKEEEEEGYTTSFKEFDFIRWHTVSTDVLPTRGSKARGIEAVINRLGITSDKVYAFGDGLNDIEMLKFVKNSVAMGNAHESVKKFAKYITKDVTEDGIAYGIEYLGLLK